MADGDEQTIQNCKIAAVCGAAQKHETLETAYAASMKGVLKCINGQFSQLQFKETPVTTLDPASSKDIADLFKVVHQVDSTLSPENLQKTDLTKAQKYAEFAQRHFMLTHYSFQIRKCVGADCCDYCQQHPATEQALPWLPCPEPGKDGHYKKFNDFKEDCVPDQRHHLSLVVQQEKQHPRQMLCTRSSSLATAALCGVQEAVC